MFKRSSVILGVSCFSALAFAQAASLPAHAPISSFNNKFKLQLGIGLEEKTPLPGSLEEAAGDEVAMAAAMTGEMGDSCVPDDAESPRIKVTLSNMKRVSDSMIAQFTKMVQDEVEEKRGPLKIGPPEIMNQMLASPRNIAAFARYHELRTQPYRKGQSPADRAVAAQETAKRLMGKNGYLSDAKDVEALNHAAEVAEELVTYLDKPLLYPSRGSSPPSKRGIWGLTPSDDRSKFFSSVENIAPALEGMNEFLGSEDSGLKYEQKLITAITDGLMIAVPWSIYTNTKNFGAVLWKNQASSVADAASGQVGKLVVISTMLQNVGSDAATVIVGVAKNEIPSTVKEAAPPVKPKDAAVTALPVDISTTGIVGTAVLSSLPKTGSSGARIEVPDVADPRPFTNAIMTIREATKSYLNNPTLLKSDFASHATPTSTNDAELGTLADTRSTNDALVLNMQSFYNTSQRARSDYVAMAKHLEASKKAKVPKEEIDKLSNTLDSDVNQMLEKMDDSTSILSNQSEYFSKGLAAIDRACTADAERIHSTWGKYRRPVRDKLGLSPTQSPVSPARAYLADAIIARADCVAKKSIARRLEMMRLGTVLIQFKSSCEDIKKWSAANKAYKNARLLLLGSKTVQIQPAMPEIREGATE